MSRWVAILICSFGIVLGASLSASAIPNPAIYFHEGKTPRGLKDVTIDLSIDSQQALSIAVRTQRLLLRSVEPCDLPGMVELFGNPKVMEKYADGKARTPEQVAARFQSFYNRWQTMDPYSGFAITLIDENLSPQEYPFLGLFVLGHGDEPGQSEMAFLLHEHCWNQGYGKEAAIAIVHNLAPFLMLKGYSLEGLPLKQIVATARIDNIASIKILEALGMEFVGISEKYGYDRRHYAIDAAHLVIGIMPH